MYGSTTNEESRDKPITHADRVIYDDFKQLARYMRRNQTPAEDMIWQRIRKKQVQGFRFWRQQAIGRFMFDFYCFESCLVLEIDGGIHDEPGQPEYDEERQQYLESPDLPCCVSQIPKSSIMQMLSSKSSVAGLQKRCASQGAV